MMELNYLSDHLRYAVTLRPYYLVILVAAL